MGRVRRLANAPCRRRRICLLPNVAWMRSVRLGIPGASVGKSSVPVPSFRKPTARSRLGSFGNRGNGEYRKELAHALGVIRRYLAALGLPQTRALLRLDGLYGTGAVLADLDGLCFVMRGKDYAVLDHPTVQARLHLPPDASFSRPESTLVRTLYDCPDVPVGKTGCRCRVVVATHRQPRKRAASVAPARAWSMNSFSPSCRKTGSPPPM
jgi:hypothetical protein